MALHGAYARGTKGNGGFMKIVSFPEQTVVFAKDQPQYLPLPAYLHEDGEGRITCCWYLSFWERVAVFFLGRIWHTVLTFNVPLQPQCLQVNKPEMPPKIMQGKKS